jgi:hypothetical protein
MLHFRKSDGCPMWCYHFGAVIDEKYKEAYVSAYSKDAADRKLRMLARKMMFAKSIWDVHEIDEGELFDDEDPETQDRFISVY